MSLPPPWDTDAQAAIQPRISPDSMYISMTDTIDNVLFIPDLLAAADADGLFSYDMESPNYGPGVFADVFQPVFCVFGWPATYSCPEGFQWVQWPSGRCMSVETGTISAADAIGVYCHDAVPIRVSFPKTYMA